MTSPTFFAYFDEWIQKHGVCQVTKRTRAQQASHPHLSFAAQYFASVPSDVNGEGYATGAASTFCGIT